MRMPWNKIIKKSYLESLPCNLCGQENFKTISKKDRYGLEVKTVVCDNCGLIFINPRMNKEGYDDFYENHYRDLIYKLKKKDVSHESIYNAGKKLGIKINDFLGDYIKPGLVIEVGSSCGGILAKLKELNSSLNFLGIEISAAEASYANDMGIKTIISSIEDLKEEVPKAENILIARSLNHLLDPSLFFRWTYDNLKEGGRLLVVVLNFPAFCAKRGKLITQVDHPFMFTSDTLLSFLKKSGFEKEFLKEEGDYIYLAARKKGNHN